MKKAIRNLPISIKLQLLVLPSVIVMLILVFAFLNQFQSIMADTERILYDEL